MATNFKQPIYATMATLLFFFLVVSAAPAIAQENPSITTELCLSLLGEPAELASIQDSGPYDRLEIRYEMGPSMEPNG